MLKNFFEGKLPRKIAVALSGGVDSMALLLALEGFARERGVELVALTVDHNLRKNSGKEALILAQMMEKKGICHEILSIDRQKVPVKNIEGELRKMRYDLLYDYCVKNDIGYLFLGHHRGDAAENFLIRLFRGSQIDGLSGMRKMVNFKKIKLCRPFLGLSKADLRKIVEDKQLVWFEDETNEDERFLRNKIRGFLASFEEKDAIEERIAKASEALAQEKKVIDEVVLDFAKKCLVFDGDQGEFLLDLDEYRVLPGLIALKILSLVVVEVSGEVYKPRLEGLKGFEGRILGLQKGRREDFYGCMAQKLAGKRRLWLKKGVERDLVRIYRDLNQEKRLDEVFDASCKIVDGRFLVGEGGEKRFYFRTILGRAFAC